jgi:hypothetical protein
MNWTMQNADPTNRRPLQTKPPRSAWLRRQAYLVLILVRHVGSLGARGVCWSYINQQPLTQREGSLLHPLMSSSGGGGRGGGLQALVWRLGAAQLFRRDEVSQVLHELNLDEYISEFHSQ